MKLVNITKTELDGETIYISEVPFSAATAIMKYEESGGKDFIALAGLIKAVLKEKDGSPYKQFKDMSVEQMADVLPAATAMKLFNLINELSLEKM